MQEREGSRYNGRIGTAVGFLRQFGKENKGKTWSVILPPRSWPGNLIDAFSVYGHMSSASL